MGRVQAVRLNREGGCNAVLVGPHAPRGGVALAKEQQPRAVHGSAHGTVAAAASWSCCHASHGLSRKDLSNARAKQMQPRRCSVCCRLQGNHCKRMRIVLIWSGRRRLQLHSTWPRHGAGSCGGRWAWEQRVRPTAGGGARMMREQLTGVARAEEWKSWMLKRRAAAGGDCRLHCANMSCCWRKQQLHARVRDDE